MSLRIDLLEMPTGERYEDRYGKYLEIFHRIATSEECVRVYNPPWSWMPLLDYLGANCDDPIVVFPHCPIVKEAMLKYWTMSSKEIDKRTAVEVLCGFRPETVDALWKVDMQWKLPEKRIMQMEDLGLKKEFMVTCNGSFFRPEVLNYLELTLPAYKPEKKKVVLLPCAADKPYPAKLHQEVKKRMPEDYYMAVVTGVLGIVPEDLWPAMPHYDSGVPYEWRLMNVVRDYFIKHEHTDVVVYVDFYSQAAFHAFEQVGKVARLPYIRFVNEIKFYEDYLDLLAPERLARLEMAFEKEVVTV